MREVNIVLLGILVFGLILIRMGLLWDNNYVMWFGIFHLIIFALGFPSKAPKQTHDETRAGSLFLTGLLLPFTLIFVGVVSIIRFFDKDDEED